MCTDNCMISQNLFVKQLPDCCCVNASFTNKQVYSLFCQSSTDFSALPFLSRLFRSLPFATFTSSLFGLTYLRLFPIVLVVLPTCHIQFENVHCSYINMINSKYIISSLKSFGSSCCHYSQKIKQSIKVKISQRKRPTRLTPKTR